MAYVQTLIDNFNDGSLDPAMWSITQGPAGVTESTGTLNMACIADYPRVSGSVLFDLTTGILATKLSTTGTRTPACEFFFGAKDAAGNYVSAFGSPNGSYISFSQGGLATTSDIVVIDETVGIGESWVPGTWWGIGNMDSANIVRMYNSTDGQIWNEMAHCTVGGTFNKTAVVPEFTTGVWDGTTPNLVANFDDASFWVPEVEVFQTRKVWWGGRWTAAVPKVRVDGAWVIAAPKPRIGGAWDPMN